MANPVPKIKYPIDDVQLYNNPEKYEIDANMYKVICINIRDQRLSRLIYLMLIR